jgi:hypothetical protein
MDWDKMDLRERSNGKRSCVPKATLKTSRPRRAKKAGPGLPRGRNQNGVTRLDNTRKLVMAALRLWELKQGGW